MRILCAKKLIHKMQKLERQVDIKAFFRISDPYSRHKESALDGSFPAGAFLMPGSSRRGTTISDMMSDGEATVRHLGRE